MNRIVKLDFTSLTRLLRAGMWAFLVLCLTAWLPFASSAQTLDSLIQEMLERNPEILAARRGVDAKRAKVPAARTLPDPSISFETMGNLIPPTLQFGDPSSARAFRFTQEIPFPGKLDLQGRIASAEADVELWRYEQVRRYLVTELRTAYYELSLAQRSQEVVEKVRILLQQLAEVTESRYRVGKAAQQDILKAQLEVSRLTDRLTILEREQATARAKISALLFRPAPAPLGTTAELARPRFSWSLERLKEKAFAANPDVRMRRTEIDRGELGVALAKKNFYPDFEVGFSYLNRTGMQEMYGVMFRAKIPLYSWRKQRPELESVTSDLIANRRRYDGTLAALSFELEAPFLRVGADSKLLDLYGEAIIPQARLALESANASYGVGAVDFLTVLANLNTVLEYEIKYYEVLSDQYKALAILESLTGEILIP